MNIVRGIKHIRLILVVILVCLAAILTPVSGIPAQAMLTSHPGESVKLQPSLQTYPLILEDVSLAGEEQSQNSNSPTLPETPPTPKQPAVKPIIWFIIGSLIIGLTAVALSIFLLKRKKDGH